MQNLNKNITFNKESLFEKTIKNTPLSVFKNFLLISLRNWYIEFFLFYVFQSILQVLKYLQFHYLLILDRIIEFPVLI